ncbi:MAG: phosphopantetheine-binding protein, partial [Bordetella sp.]|nr:phosphopantetheine-binding protein [Bordetella sp.]
LAACVTADAPIGDGRALREALAGLLPEAMVPARFVAVAAMPRLDNGKVDRRALGALLAEPDAGAAAAPARDALEQVVAASVAALLERPQVGIHDDFFQLGGHSLLVIRLVTRLRKQLRVEVEPGVVFDHPTVAQLAQALRAAAPDPAALDDIAAARVQLAALDPQARAALATSLAEPA